MGVFYQVPGSRGWLGKKFLRISFGGIGRGAERPRPSLTMHRSLVGLASDNDPQQGLQRGGSHAHGRRSREGLDRVRDGAVLGRVRGILPQSRSAAHPHIHDDRVPVPGDGASECVRLRSAQAVEAFPDATVRSIHVGVKTLRRDALRVLGGLSLVMGPSDAGRERGDNGRSDLQRPLGTLDAQRLGKLPRIIVPCHCSVQVEERSGGEEADETLGGLGSDGGVAGSGGGHASIVLGARFAWVGVGRNYIKKFILG